MVKYWRENGIDVVLYLDDGFGMCTDKSKCIEDSNFVKKSLEDAGFLINEGKSIFSPVQSLEWLGIVWNASEFSLVIPDRRVNDLRVSLVSVIGRFPNITARTISSGCSGKGAGAYSVELDKKIFHETWDFSEAQESSTWRELKAIELALISFKNVFEGKTLKWYTDNQNCVKIVKAGSMNEKLQILALSIFSVCIQKCISIDIQWIPRSQNSQADYISRMVDYEDWGVSNEFFSIYE
ncbi:Hypothetical predicted protein [Mytilus galloprovincialis]|uniref:Reverse transcriptase domain-containing protein n=1 Tax=Mytilus galloprovincialis TaxID=29158 RepID=A0A8B6DTS7_MYTGA|nr:Hypothetical predicted protein [Mytilus galloprovincialis]